MCRERRDDALLTRAGRDANGFWYLGRGSGRGLWWCSEGNCGGLVRVTNAQRALRTSFDEIAVERCAAFLRGLKMAVDVKE